MVGLWEFLSYWGRGRFGLWKSNAFDVYFDLLILLGILSAYLGVGGLFVLRNSEVFDVSKYFKF